MCHLPKIRNKEEKWAENRLRELLHHCLVFVLSSEPIKLYGKRAATLLLFLGTGFSREEYDISLDAAVALF